MDIKQTIKKIDWKPAAITYGIMSVVFFFAFFYSAWNGSFPVDHNPAVPGNSNYPESYTVGISPALAFKYTWSIFRVLGIIIWLGLGAFLVAYSNDMLGTKEKSAGAWATRNFNVVVFGGMLLAALCVFAGHSSKVAGNNTRVVDPVRYERIKDNKDSLKSLFNKKDLY